jgi:hypothetical protein
MLRFATILLTPAWLIIGGWALVLAAVAYGLGFWLESRSPQPILIDD